MEVEWASMLFSTSSLTVDTDRGGLLLLLVAGVVAVAPKAKKLFFLMIVTVPSTNRTKACNFKDPLSL